MKLQTPIFLSILTLAGISASAHGSASMPPRDFLKALYARESCICEHKDNTDPFRKFRAAMGEILNSVGRKESAEAYKIGFEVLFTRILGILEDPGFPSFLADTPVLGLKLSDGPSAPDQGDFKTKNPHFEGSINRSFEKLKAEFYSPALQEHPFIKLAMDFFHSPNDLDQDLKSVFLNFVTAADGLITESGEAISWKILTVMIISQLRLKEAFLEQLNPSAHCSLMRLEKMRFLLYFLEQKLELNYAIVVGETALEPASAGCGAATGLIERLMSSRWIPAGSEVLRAQQQDLRQQAAARARVEAAALAAARESARQESAARVEAQRERQRQALAKEAAEAEQQRVAAVLALREQERDAVERRESAAQIAAQAFVAQYSLPHVLKTRLAALQHEIASLEGSPRYPDTRQKEEFLRALNISLDLFVDFAKPASRDAQLAKAKAIIAHEQEVSKRQQAFLDSLKHAKTSPSKR